MRVEIELSKREAEYLQYVLWWVASEGPPQSLPYQEKQDSTPMGTRPRHPKLYKLWERVWDSMTAAGVIQL